MNTTLDILHKKDKLICDAKESSQKKNEFLRGLLEIRLGEMILNRIIHLKKW